MTGLENVEVVTFTNPVEALSWSTTNEPDLVLLDFLMPEMDGCEFLHQFRNMDHLGDVPVVIVTIDQSRESMYRALDAGANDFLRKPVDDAELIARVRNMLLLRAHQLELKAARIEAETSNANLVKADLRLNDDIAERERVAAALKDSEERFRSVVNNSPTKIHIKDVEGRYILVNSEAEKLYGVTEEEAMGKTARDIFPDKQAAVFRAHDQAILDTGKAMEQEEQWELDDGVHTYLTVKFPIRGGGGEIVGIGAIGTDITERKRIQKALQNNERVLQDRVELLEETERKLQNQGEDLVRLADDLLTARDEARTADRVKSEFLAAMSHELRTPLNAIIGFSDIMKLETLGPIGNVRYHDYAEDINESGNHLLTLINDILDLSKIESGADELHEENIDILELATTIMKLVTGLAHAGNVEIELDVSDDISLLHADERRVKQILLNLLSNAIKFTPDGGKITLRIWSCAESGCVFQVTDTGIGIAIEDIPKALAPFQQVDADLNRQFEGTGLGLPLTKALVELHGGTLDLQSQIGVGTTVMVRFPAARIVHSPHNVKAINAVDMKVG